MAADENKEDAAVRGRLKTIVHHLAGSIGPRSLQSGTNLAAAADFITGSLESFGFTVIPQAYEVDGHQVRNIIAEREGLEEPDHVLILGAHYDTRVETPGADDNASGVAVLLELARLHAQTPFRKTVRFIAFTLEEAPYFRTRHMGSRVYVRSLKDRGEQVEAMISLEMLGYYSQEEGSQSYPFFWLRWWHPSEGNFITVVSNFSSTDLRDDVRDALKASMDLPVETFTGPWWIPGVDLSDHGSFWNEDYPAVMLTDTAFYRNPHYHERTDRPETLDYQAMGELVQGVSSMLSKLDLSLPSSRPH
jgi:Zn-dependent M28 family amino/carboxypeptidase